MCKIENRGKFAVMIIKIWDPGKQKKQLRCSSYCLHIHILSALP